jgi:hypothetical protein
MKRTTKTKKNVCSPKYQTGKKSCLPPWALKHLITEYNKKYAEDPIVVKTNDKDDFVLFWEALSEKMSKKNVCHYGDEKCWSRKLNPTFHHSDSKSTLYQVSLPHTFEKKFFAHSVPKKWKENVETWLTNHDIQNIMSQYMDKHDHFLFIGPVPNDFELEKVREKCIVKELCPKIIQKFVKKWQKEKKSNIGIIFNTDPHDQSGAHWIAAFVNIDPRHPEVFYYDSYGAPPSLEISTFLRRVADELEKESGRRVPVKINTNRHQYIGSQCGIYCIHFIITMLERNAVEEDAFEKYTSHDYTQGKSRDEVMRQHRKKYWDWEHDHDEDQD